MFLLAFIAVDVKAPRDSIHTPCFVLLWLAVLTNQVVVPLIHFGVGCLHVAWFVSHGSAWSLHECFRWAWKKM